MNTMSMIDTARTEMEAIRVTLMEQLSPDPDPIRRVLKRLPEHAYLRRLHADRLDALERLGQVADLLEAANAAYMPIAARLQALATAMELPTAEDVQAYAQAIAERDLWDKRIERWKQAHNGLSMQVHDTGKAWASAWGEYERTDAEIKQIEAQGAKPLESIFDTSGRMEHLERLRARRRQLEL